MYRHYVPFGFQPNYINLAKITGLAKIKFDIEGSNVSEYYLYIGQKENTYLLLSLGFLLRSVELTNCWPVSN